MLAGDLGYVIVFPQFLMAVHWPHCVNTVGSIAGATVGIGKCFFDFIEYSLDTYKYAIIRYHGT